jgi:hypothetical protein
MFVVCDVCNRITLLQKQAYIARMLNFSERFMDRFIEMAVGDTDEQVSFDTVKMLRAMQM